MDFTPMPKVPRLSREMVVTEKIDGTNASVWITPSDVERLGHDPEVLATAVDESGVHQDVRAGSRNRWATLENDNFGFARWVTAHAEELVDGLGEGVHYGEWWGAGIQRRYDLDHKRFSLFNAGRWTSRHTKYARQQLGQEQDGVEVNWAPECCHVVPILYEGFFSVNDVDNVLDLLEKFGSSAAPGFMRPEGVMVYHVAARQYFKKTLDGDGHKG